MSVYDDDDDLPLLRRKLFFITPWKGHNGGDFIAIANKFHAPLFSNLKRFIS